MGSGSAFILLSWEPDNEPAKMESQADALNGGSAYPISLFPICEHFHLILNDPWVKYTLFFIYLTLTQIILTHHGKQECSHISSNHEIGFRTAMG